MDKLLLEAQEGKFTAVITDKPKNFLHKNQYLQLFSSGVALYFTKPLEDLSSLGKKKKKQWKNKSLQTETSFLQAVSDKRK